YYWLMAMEMSRDNPIFGIGYGNFDLHFWEYVKAYQSKPDSIYFQFTLEHIIRGVRPGFVHNDVLQRLTEGGLIGCGLWLAWWSRFFAESLVKLRSARSAWHYPFTCCFVPALGAIFIDGLVNYSTHLPVSGMLCFVMLGLWVSVSRYELSSED